MKEVKTNAMRILDKNKIDYQVYQYHVDEEDGSTLGIKIAEATKQPMEKLYKTLLTIGQSKHYYVFVIPVDKNLDLKKAAASVKEKNVEMVHVKDIMSISGYIRGGCSPIGMKKQFVTVFNETINNLDTVIISGGKIGFQVELKVKDLLSLVNGKTHDILKN